MESKSLMKFEIEVFSQEDSQYFPPQGMRIHGFLSNLESEKGKREKLTNPKIPIHSKERIQILHEKGLGIRRSRRFPIFPPQGMEIHRFLSFWKMENGKWEIDKSKEPRIFMKFENHGIQESKNPRIQILENRCFLSNLKKTKGKRKNGEKRNIPIPWNPRKNQESS